AWDGPQRVVSWFCVAVAALVAARHHGNVRRLLAGTENRLKERSAMSRLAKVFHLLALGTWFGSIVLFTLTGGLLFSTFRSLGERPPEERPWWFPPPRGRPKKAPVEWMPRPEVEQGFRAAGAAVTPLFPWYYGLQLGCAVVAAVTALAWAAQRRGRHYRMRAWLVTAALLAVVAGFAVERIVADARGPRNELSDAFLRSEAPGSDEIQRAQIARAAFQAWHTVSLALNGVTLLLVGACLVLAAWLPEETATPRGQAPEPQPEQAKALA